MTSLPASWCMAPLGSLGSWSGGATPSKSNPSFWNGDIPWVSAKDLKQRRIGNVPDRITQDALDSTSAKLLPPDSVIMVTRSGILAHTFPVASTDRPVVINQDLKAIEPADGVDSRYLSWVIEASGPSILHTCSREGTTVASVELNKLQRFEVPLAPYNEQQRLVLVLDEAESRLAAAEREASEARAKLAAYRAAVLRAACEGRLVPTEAELVRAEVTLGDVTLSLQQGWSPQCEPQGATASDEWAVIKTTAVQPLKFIPEENKRLPAALEPRPALQVEVGDILVTRAGPRARAGISCLVRRSRSRLMVCDKVYRLRVHGDRVEPAYLELVLNSPEVLKRMEEMKSGISDSGVNLTQDRFRELAFELPELASQRSIVAEVERRLSVVERLEAAIDANLARAKRLRQAILKRAFEGRLVPQDPSDEPASVLLERIRKEREGAGTSSRGRRAKPRGRP